MTMSLKPNAQLWTVLEQIVRDDASGLICQFEVAPDGSPRLRLFGEALPFGNREIVFSLDGKEAGAGTHTGLCRPAWLTALD
ncbi:MAG: hypothetical protein GIKADHBN_01422 [Phycisphaerales bacterium]|nr:hypothetical protein [Phycisphaerales bacterium]